MARTFHFRPLVQVAVALALLAWPLTAQNNPTVEHVTVRGSGDAMEVEIQTSGPAVSPNTQAITGPDRILIDFPGAVPSSQLRALTVNRGPIKAVRSGLFFNNPPITRVVLDLTAAQSYHIATTPNGVVLKLGMAAAAMRNQAPGESSGGPQLRQTALVSGAAPAKFSPADLPGATVSIVRVPIAGATSGASLNPTSGNPPSGSPSPGSSQQGSAAIQAANLAVDGAPATNAPAAGLVGVGENSAIAASADAAPAAPPEPPKPSVNVAYENGMLTIQSDKATLSQVLFEVHLKTQADIAIPAGAEQEQVVANLGPGPARDVLSSLLNGSPYNFIFVGNELSLERVILTRRDPNLF